MVNSNPNFENLTAHIAQLANLNLTAEEQVSLPVAMEETIAVVDELQKIDVTGVEPTTRVSQGMNRWRSDEVDHEQMFTQQQALANARQTHQGYFVVERLIDHEA